MCQHCQSTSQWHLDAIRSVAFFENTPLKPAIHKFKYQNHQALSADFALLLATCYQSHQLRTDIIVPVPLHQARYKERGYNQSALLAKSLSPLLKQPVDTQTLIRQRATKTQTALNAADRWRNVADAFICLSDALSHKSILLIDDVCTTGATLNACAYALKQANTCSIYGLTLARSG